MPAEILEKNTALTDVHVALGAKMIPFAGYLMPVSYSSINEEHITVRKKVGLFDVSHMGEFILKGEKAADLLQLICTNDIARLYPGKVQYSCMTNENGGIIDDLLIYQLNEQDYMLVVNASNIQKDWDWITHNNTDDVGIHDLTDKTTLLAIQGPKAIDALQQLTELDLSSLEYYSFSNANFAGIDNVMISATGYTGAGGFEMYFENGNARHIWETVFSAGKEFGIKPIGLAARDTLRLEMGYCLYGNDIDDTTSPLEAGLGWITKFNKDFTGKDKLLALKEKGISRKLIGFEMTDRGIPRHDYEITGSDKQVIGRVTSGTQSPSLKKAIGMGYVPVRHAEEGTEIFISIRDKYLKAKVVKFPFYDKSNLKQ